MTPPFQHKDWAELLPFLKEDTRKDVVYLVREFINIIVSFFRGQLIVALFFCGTAFDGIAGMILAIPLTAFLVVFWRLVKAKYITEIV